MPLKKNIQRVKKQRPSKRQEDGIVLDSYSVPGYRESVSKAEAQGAENRRLRGLTSRWPINQFREDVRKIQDNEPMYHISRDNLTLYQIRQLTGVHPDLDVQPWLPGRNMEMVLNGRHNDKGEPLYKVTQYGLTLWETQFRVNETGTWPMPGAHLGFAAGYDIVKFNGDFAHKAARDAIEWDEKTSRYLPKGRPLFTDTNKYKCRSLEHGTGLRSLRSRSPWS